MCLLMNSGDLNAIINQAVKLLHVSFLGLPADVEAVRENKARNAPFIDKSSDVWLSAFGL